GVEHAGTCGGVAAHTERPVIQHGVAVVIKAGCKGVRAAGVPAQRGVHVDVSRQATIDTALKMMALVIGGTAPLRVQIVIVGGLTECTIRVVVARRERVIGEQVGGPSKPSAISDRDSIEA